MIVIRNHYDGDVKATRRRACADVEASAPISLVTAIISLKDENVELFVDHVIDNPIILNAQAVLVRMPLHGFYIRTRTRIIG